MVDKEKPNPFKPGTGHTPPLLAGREEETRILTQALKLLGGDRVKDEVRLVSDPMPPIKMVGPRGVGKTALITWTKREAKQHGVHAVRCAYLGDGEGRDHPMQDLIEAMEGGSPDFLELISEIGLSLPIIKIGFKKEELVQTYGRLIRSILKEAPLLLLLDEVHHYDRGPLTQLLQSSQQLISDGYPLGLVLAGTPGLDSRLNKAKSTFITRSKDIYVNTLSDKATREALMAPFDDETITVTPKALDAMVAQTDNYPYFIQLVGAEVWDRMVATESKEVDVGLVAQAEERARNGRVAIYAKAYDRMEENGLLLYARQVMELLESKGGQVSASTVLNVLKNNPGVDSERAGEIRDGLREDGFIWTVHRQTSPGIPSFFDYFKAEQKKQ